MEACETTPYPQKYFSKLKIQLTFTHAKMSHILIIHKQTLSYEDSTSSQHSTYRLTKCYYILFLPLNSISNTLLCLIKGNFITPNNRLIVNNSFLLIITLTKPNTSSHIHHLIKHQPSS